MESTGVERISDTVRFKHHAITIPNLTLADRISMGGHRRRVPFQRHPNCSTRLRNVNAKKPNQRKAFVFNAKKAWYTTPYFQHYRTFKGIMESTGVERISDTVRFKHHAITIPNLTPADRILVRVMRATEPC